MKGQELDDGSLKETVNSTVVVPLLSCLDRVLVCGGGPAGPSMRLDPFDVSHAATQTKMWEIGILRIHREDSLARVRKFSVALKFLRLAFSGQTIPPSHHGFGVKIASD
jgi:hypothetical protein